MAFSRVYAGAVVGLEAHLVTVEVNFEKRGYPAFNIVGLAAKEINEARERVKSAIKNSGYKFPIGKITVSLSPADLPKKGSMYDLPISIGILAVSGLLEIDSIDQFIFAGELSLNGKIKPISNSIFFELLSKENLKNLITGKSLSKYFEITSEYKIIQANFLKDVCEHINGTKFIQPNKEIIRNPIGQEFDIEMDEIKGMDLAKRAIMIAIAGGHHLMLVGPPGSGKTSLARAIPSILPQLSEIELTEILKIYSTIGASYQQRILPFRSPLYNISTTEMFGGGASLSPGEISLAHNGILFLDEILLFKWEIIEKLRNPLENKFIEISKFHKTHKFPCNFTLIATTNPCYCGNYGNYRKKCVCNFSKIQNYKSKIFSPVIDRIDMSFICNPTDYTNLLVDKNISLSQTDMKSKILIARKIQNERYKKSKAKLLNGNLSSNQVKIYCQIDKNLNDIFHKKLLMLGLSNRSYFKILKIARTITDIEESPEIKMEHIDEAIQYKSSLQNLYED